MSRLTKGQMFDFILRNNVTITIDTSFWRDINNDPVEKKYCVTINGIDMGGYDLENAINYYVSNLQGEPK